MTLHLPKHVLLCLIYYHYTVIQILKLFVDIIIYTSTMTSFYQPAYYLYFVVQYAISL